MLDKIEIRKAIKCLRSKLSRSFIEESSRNIEELLFSLKSITNANLILAYSSFKNEVMTDNIIDRLLKMNKQVALPFCKPDKTELLISLIADRSDLKPGTYGILEPKSPNLNYVSHEDVQIAIVPGIAFDLYGNRVGFGKGYYDKLLSTFPQSTIKIALCYNFQLYDKIPSDKHDIRVDYIVTENSIITTSNQSEMS